MKKLLLVALAGTLGACSDQQPLTAPGDAASVSAAKQSGNATALLVPVDDASARLATALGSSADAEQVRTLLGSIGAQLRAGKAAQVTGSAPVRNLASALDRLEAADPSLAPDVDAVRLAIAPLR